MTTGAFQRLVDLVAPPSAGAAVQWADVEDRLGLTLPLDYKLIVETYGAGLFGDEVTVWVPGGAGGEDLFSEGPAALEVFGEVREFVVEDHQTWVEPDGSESPVNAAAIPAGFTPWGGGASGAYGFWHRVGDDPEAWPVLYVDFREALYLYHRGGIAGFIVDLLTSTYPRDRILVELPRSPGFAAIP
ncbi:SMI1/KNR4 family protein [Gordonia sp. ABKF26]|uniref:SMI1/KNR4 family protein n=1 Tax=Gordonia sp. ABKF26 TaxID=3238687 RepID=UPI0034E3818E